MLKKTALPLNRAKETSVTGNAMATQIPTYGMNLRRRPQSSAQSSTLGKLCPARPAADQPQTRHHPNTVAGVDQQLGNGIAPVMR